MPNKPDNQLKHLYREDLETAVLATILAYPASCGIAIQQLQEMWPRTWTASPRRRIASIIHDLYTAGDTPDLVTVSHGLENSEHPEDIDILRHLTGSSESADVLDQRARELHDVTAARDLYFHIDTTRAELTKTIPDNISGYVAKLQENISGAALGAMQPSLIADVSKRATQLYFDAKAGKTTPGIPVGVPGVIVPYNTTTVLGGRPSHGKSAQACWWAWNAAAAGYPVVMFTHEPTDQQILVRMACQKSRCAFKHAQGGAFSSATERRYLQALQELARLPIIIYDMPGASPLQCRAALQYAIRHKFNGHKPLVFVDYLQLERIPDFPVANETAEVGEISSIWLSTFRQTGAAGVLLSQLSREGAKGEPKLSHLRQSGAIEQDASAVYFVHRPGRDDPEAAGNCAILLRAKNRDGDLMRHYQHFTGYCMHYEPWDPSVHKDMTEENMVEAEKRAVREQSRNAPAKQPDLKPEK